MGPRLVSRGDCQRGSVMSSWVGPSMGPRLVSRGDVGCWGWGNYLLAFNGAAACEPRRLSINQPPFPQRLPFNGAAACEPRRPTPENGQYWRAFPTYIASATQVPARSDGKTKTSATSYSILLYGFQRTSFPASVSGSPPHHLHARRSHYPVPPRGEIAGR